MQETQSHLWHRRSVTAIAGARNETVANSIFILDSPKQEQLG